MKYTIQDLADGKCAVKNDGTRADLLDVMILAFPEGILPEGTSPYYKKGNYSGWTSGTFTDLPIQSVKDFLEDTFKVGEEVEVSDGQNAWSKRVYIGKIPDKYQDSHPFIVINLAIGGRVVSQWKYARKLKTPVITELTLQQIADKFEVKVENLKIIK